MKESTRNRGLSEVLLVEETRKVLMVMPGEEAVMAKLLYGCGLRVMECLRHHESGGFYEWEMGDWRNRQDAKAPSLGCGIGGTAEVTENTEGVDRGVLNAEILLMILHVDR